MRQPAVAVPVVYLRPGDLKFADRPMMITTVLGSCVAVTMYHKRLRLGAMCHGLLPDGPSAREPEGFRYLAIAVSHMAERFRTAGARPEQVEVKLFGGADVLRTAAEGRAGTVGARNAEAARRAVEAEGLTVACADLRGRKSRKIFFNTETGEVLLKRLSGASVPRGERA